MRALAGSLILVALLGCSSAGRVPAGSGHTATPSSIDCLEVAQLSAAGEHKPAADGMAILASSNVDCSPDVVAAAGESRRLVAAADELARRGLEERHHGDLAAARISFEEALAIYPKYYWVRRLERELPRVESEKISTMFERASELRLLGELEEALAVLEEALALAPENPRVKAAASQVRNEIADRYLAAVGQARDDGDLEGAADLLNRAIDARPELETTRVGIVDAARNLGLSLFSAGELLRARAVWLSALLLDSTDATLLGYLDEVETRLESLNAIKDVDDE